jgi:hypothetical protein
MSNPKLHWKFVFASGLPIPTFAKCLLRRNANVGSRPLERMKPCPRCV